METSIVTVLPEQIEVDSAENSRRYPISAASVKNMAQSLLREGQLAPVTVIQHPDPDSQYDYKLVFGYRRHKAAVLINQDAENGHKFYLRAEVLDKAQADNMLRLNVAENSHRRDLSPIDQAYSMSRMSTEGRSVREIADVFDTSPATVSQRLKLLDAPSQVLKLVHDGRINTTVVLEALRHPAGSAERQKAMDAILAEPAAMDRRTVAQAAQRATDDGEDASSPAATRKKKANRTAKEILADLAEYADSGDEEEPTPGQTAAWAVHDYVAGKSGFGKLKKLLNSISGFE